MSIFETSLSHVGEQSRCIRILRLHVLRNQLLHGGATWNSAANRSQVRDGAAILGHLLLLFIDLMMDNPGEDWTMPLYPVIED